ncbi:MAG: TonB-dependent receptor plug domain-containing protein [Bacteroidetes bacterium]|nr:TonB-dependent receptor plug domain-containing protein [Bacteroidota bacterium]
MNLSAFSRYILVFIFSAAFFITKAQTINDVQNSLEVLATNFPHEKIYIQFDKPSYVPGETIWFKAYIMAGADPSLISKTLYIDFINSNGRILKHCISPVLQSSGFGDYAIPLDFKDDEVYVKAYTKWMTNFDSTFLFHKTIHVIQTKQVVWKKNTTTVKTTIRFLPEGGDMINSIESNIAFKALNYDGNPAKISGAVFNNENQQVAVLKVTHDGMGSFLLTPKNGEIYTAKWKDDAGNNYVTKLPSAKNEGASIKVLVQANARSFLIQRSENAPANFRKLYILATMQQHLVYGASVNLSESAATGGSIPIANLPSGILQISLFDSNWVEIAERITFINNNDYSFEPEVGLIELGLEKRKENTLVIKTPDAISANLSVAVTDAGIGIDSSDGIVSRLLLTSDLRGVVYHPNYYFTNNSDSLQQQLDLVMLTNGWRRIEWDSVIRNKYPVVKYVNDTSYLSLSGRVFGATEQDLRRGAFILMIIDNKQDTARRTQQVMVDPSGNFSNPNIILYDTSKIYYRISGNESFANSSVINFNNSSPAAKITAADTASAPFYSDSATENYKRRLAQQQMLALKMQQGTTLDEVIVKTKVKSPMQLLDEKYASPLFSSSDAYQFDAMNDPFARGATNVLQYLQGKVAGLQITVAGMGGDNSSLSWRGGTPGLFMNEMPVDVNQLASINMSDVAYIKVFRPPFFGAVGGNGANGAIAVYTRRGADMQQAQNSGGLPYKLIIGYTTPKEFYSPDYATYDQRNESADLRTTLFWDPMILTQPGSNTIKIKFFNNDYSQSFRIVLEGISTDGRFAHIEKVIE